MQMAYSKANDTTIVTVAIYSNLKTFQYKLIPCVTSKHSGINLALAAEVLEAESFAVTDDVRGGLKLIQKWFFPFAVPPVRVILCCSLVGGSRLQQREN